MNVKMSEMPALRVAAVRHVGPYNRVKEAFERLGAIAGPAGMTQEPGAMMVGIYHDDPFKTPPDQLRSDAAIVIAEDAPVPAGLSEGRIHGGRYACAVHVGPYEQLGDAWTRFMTEWLPASGYRMREGASYEIYRNDPGAVPKEQLRTDMYIPVA